MSDQDRLQDTEIRHYLPHAVAATLWVVVLPMVLVTMYVQILDPPPSRLLSATVGVLLSIAATVAGTVMWMRRPGSGVVSFGDLMLWGWIRRYRAEKSLRDGSRVLGFDRKGRPVGQVNLTVDEQLKVLHQLNDALEKKDPYTHGHSRRVEKHCYRMGLQLGLAETDLDDLRLAAALHDVGKVAVPDSILRKPGRLEPTETAVMNEHPVVGERMVTDIRNETIIRAIRHHHEEFAGGGYPDGIAGEQIPQFSRIIAVADTYDAMTSTRPYRTGMPRKKAVTILTEEKGKQFDPEVVDAFLADHAVPMPIPVGLAQILEAPREFLMRLLLWGKQVGTASLASASAAAGIAVASVAGVLAPSTPASNPAVAAPSSGGDSSELTSGDSHDSHDVVLGLRVEREKKDKKADDGDSENEVSDDEVLGLVVPPSSGGGGGGPGNGGGNKPSDNGRNGGNNPPVDPPPVDPPPVDPPPVDPPGETPPPDTGGNNGGGGGGEPPGGGPEPQPGFPPPGPPAQRPPHTPGTDPQPNKGNDTEPRAKEHP